MKKFQLDLLTETPVTFAGLNGYGTVSIAKNSKNETYWILKMVNVQRILKTAIKLL